MDGAQEVERNRTARAVSAKVHTRERRRVSFGEPEENTCGRRRGALLGRFGWTNGCANRFGAEPVHGEAMPIDKIFKSDRAGVGSRQTGQTVVELALLLPLSVAAADRANGNRALRVFRYFDFERGARGSAVWRAEFDSGGGHERHQDGSAERWIGRDDDYDPAGMRLCGHSVGRMPDGRSLSETAHVREGDGKRYVHFAV